MRLSLNVEKSIQRDWVVNDHQDFGVIFNRVFNILFRVVFVGGMLIGFPLFLWYGVYIGQITIDSPIVFPGTLLIFGLIGLYGSIFVDKFVRFRGGHDITENKEIILRIFKEFYPKHKFYTGGHSFLTSYFKWKGWNGPSRRIFVIFDHNDILVNISVLSDAGIQSPFHTIFHHWTISRIKDRFDKEVNRR